MTTPDETRGVPDAARAAANSAFRKSLDDTSRTGRALDDALGAAAPFIVAAAVGGVSDDRIAQLEALADDWHEWAQAIVNGDQAARARSAVYLRCSSELRTILEGKR